MPSLTPEQKAREKIDRQLEQAGWLVQSYREMNITAGLGVAIREFPLASGPCDYLLYAGAKAIGIVEAKPEGHSVLGVAEQAARYRRGIPKNIPCHSNPLPFTYEGTGAETQFENYLDPDPRSREVFTFHRPEELLRLAGLEGQLRANLRKMPPLDSTRLWAVQAKAIGNLEKSFAENRPKALIQMATGSGKTFTACNFCYRLVKFARARRILFLVDRNNLGKQALTEFQQFLSPHNSYKFTEEFNVQHLRRNTLDPAAKVVITTIQRLYSILKGEEDYDEANEESSMFEAAHALHKEPLPVVYNPALPVESFDFIVVDECHRSIYNVWRQVLEYFDAFLVGLTATPSAQTVGFFHGNVVQDYSHAQAVVDGVNVGYDVYRIETRITQGGATLQGEPGLFIPRRDRRTRKRRLAELDAPVPYTPGELDRDVVNEDQIRLVLSTFRDRLFTDIFPGRSAVPKTLVFAKNDLHADDITRIAREVFGLGNEFCQKITSKTTGRKPEELLNEFRNSYHPRIAVTVDMIATGTDVKSLECLLFMRNINSASYFEQMKGRGCRVVDANVLQAVTPDAKHKTRYVIVDAVGVCESDKTGSRPLDRKPYVSLDKVLISVAAGMANEEVVSALAAKLARLAREIGHDQAGRIEQEAGPGGLQALCARLLESIDPDRLAAKAAEKFGLSGEAEPAEEQLDQVEQASIQAALKPFHNPKLREAILAAKASLEQVIDEINPDTLLRAGFDAAARQKAQSILEDFRGFIEENKNQIEALKLLYSRPHRAGLRYRHVRDLAAKLDIPPFYIKPQQPETVGRLWSAYEAVEPEKVKGRGGRSLVDLIALVRHAIQPEQPLVPVSMTVEERYRQWLRDKGAAGLVFTPEQRQWLDAIKDHIAQSLAMDQQDFEEVPFSQLGGLGKAHQLFGERLSALLGELNERLVA